MRIAPGQTIHQETGGREAQARYPEGFYMFNFLIDVLLEALSRAKAELRDLQLAHITLPSITNPCNPKTLMKRRDMVTRPLI